MSGDGDVWDHCRFYTGIFKQIIVVMVQKAHGHYCTTDVKTVYQHIYWHKHYMSSPQAAVKRFHGSGYLLYIDSL